MFTKILLFFSSYKPGGPDLKQPKVCDSTYVLMFFLSTGHDAPILAGMWGVKIEPIRAALRLTLLEVLRDPASYAPRQVDLGAL